MFTVKQLARLSGVTPRTLHYYDSIGLLEPSRVGTNGYRYYDEWSLLRLQQILFYRELDMPLEEIRRIMGRRDFDVLQALESHKAALRSKLGRLNRLIQTVDATIDHLKRKLPMDEKDFFQGFTEQQEQAYAEEAMRRYDPRTVKASIKKWKGYTSDEKQRIGAEARSLYSELIAAIPAGPASPEAQAAVAGWRCYIEYFWAPNDEQLLGLADLYNDDPRFRANFARLDPRLAEFIRAAVKIYVQNRK